MSKVSVIILSGGTSRRFGTDKSQAILRGQSLIQILISNIASEIPIVIVGEDPHISARTYQVTREEPVLGGPVAAIAAGLALVTTDLVAICATDMPYAPTLFRKLSAILTDELDCVMPVDVHGFRQPLAAVYRASSLLRALSAWAGTEGESMKNLISTMKIAEVQVPPHALIDIDTPEDLAQLTKNS